jgi:hypothetical protein
VKDKTRPEAGGAQIWESAAVRLMTDKVIEVRYMSALLLCVAHGDGMQLACYVGRS